jgi:hypothetical protein
MASMTIKVSDLTGTYSMTDKMAQKIIDIAENATINGKIAKITNKKADSFDVIEPDGLLGDRWFFVLTTKKDEVVALLGYDPKTKQFISEEEDLIEAYVVEAPEIVEALGKVAEAIDRLKPYVEQPSD